MGAALLGGLLAWHGVWVPWTLVLAPLAMLWVALVACGVGVLLSALVTLWRDVGHAMAFLLQAWMLVTPVLYPLSLLPPAWRPLAFLNPMTGPVEAFRAAVLGTALPLGGCLACAGAGLVVLVAGLVAFQHVERRFADLA